MVVVFYRWHTLFLSGIKKIISLSLSLSLSLYSLESLGGFADLQSESSTIDMMFMGVKASSSRSRKSMLSVFFSIDFEEGDMLCMAASTANCESKAENSELHLDSHMDVAPHAEK